MKYILLITTILMISACSEKRNEPDSLLSHEVEFSDYGTYGRTLYFEDDSGDQWCFYNVLKVENPNYVDVVYSYPIKGSCNLDTTLLSASFRSLIVSEKVDGDSAYTLLVSGTNVNEYLYASNGDFSEGNEEYQQHFTAPINPLAIKYILPRNGEEPTTDNSVYELKLSFRDGFLMSNVLPLVPYFEGNAYLSIIVTSYLDLLDMLDPFYEYGRSLPDTSLPFPEMASGGNDLKLIDDQPYTRLYPTDNDPFVFNQIPVVNE